MKIILAPDSFKGSFTSEEVSAVLERIILRRLPSTEIVKIPISDGGEGVLNCFEKVLGGTVIPVPVSGPNGKRVNASFLMCGDTAVIESAAAAGLTLANPKSAKYTTTFGVGELINSAEHHGAKHILLGLGGSATNDGGAGMAVALGNRFYDSEGKSFVPTGATLNKITRIVFEPNTHNVTALCDVKNPLFGLNGAAYVYAPQKGATQEDTQLLDNGLRHYANILEKHGCTDFDIPGAGAAGGLGAGVIAFLGGTLRRGIDVILDAIDFDSMAKSADYIITGEGSLDRQSFSGKAIDGILARKQNAKLLIVAGESHIHNPLERGITAIFETNPTHKPFEEIKENAREDLERCAQEIADYLFIRH